MRYIHQTGYDAIIALESETCLQQLHQQFASLGSTPTAVTLRHGTKTADVTAQPGDTLRALLEQLSWQTDDLKAVHIGYPVGGLFTAQVLDKPLTAALLEQDDLCAGSMEIHLLDKGTCIVDYLLHLTESLQGDCCGRCVYCREGLRQIRRIVSDVTLGKQTPDDMDLLHLLADGMVNGAHCLYGRSVGRLWLKALEEFHEELEAHVRRRRCDALVCKKYYTYHILPNLCDGCMECLDECPDEAIEGKRKYIHVIDSFECDRCGKCAEICPKSAIVKAGAIKPRTPEEPVPVGKWRGR